MKSQYPNLLNGHFGPVAFDSADEHRTYIIGLISGNPETRDEEVYAVTDWIAKNQSDALRPHNNNAATPKAAIYAIAESPLPHMSADERRRIYAFVLANTAGLSMLFPGDDRNEVFNTHDGKRQPGIIILSDNVDTRESAPGSQQSRHMLSVMLSVAEGMKRAASGNQNSGSRELAEMQARVDQATATAEEAAQNLTRERDDNIQLRQQLADAHSEIETLRRLSGRSFVTDSESVVDVPPQIEPVEMPAPPAPQTEPPGATPGAPTAAQLKARLKTK